LQRIESEKTRMLLGDFSAVDSFKLVGVTLTRLLFAFKNEVFKEVRHTKDDVCCSFLLSMICGID
jgi:hypothetical protein